VKKGYDKSYLAIEAAQSALDAIGAFLFILSVYFLMKVTFFTPFINPYELKRHAAKSYGISASSKWDAIASEAEDKTFEKLKKVYGLNPKEALSAISKKQQDNWPWLTWLDQT